MGEASAGRDEGRLACREALSQASLGGVRGVRAGEEEVKGEG